MKLDFASVSDSLIAEFKAYSEKVLGEIKQQSE